MAQTSTYFGLINNPLFEMNTTGGSTYTSYSGEIISVAWGGGARKAGEVNTYDGDTPIIGEGKRESVELTVRYVYSGSGAASASFGTILQGIYENTTAASLRGIYVRFSPSGSAAGRWRQTSSGSGILITPPYQTVEAGQTDPVMGEVTIKFPGFTTGSI